MLEYFIAKVNVKCPISQREIEMSGDIMTFSKACAKKNRVEKHRWYTVKWV